MLRETKRTALVLSGLLAVLLLLGLRAERPLPALASPPDCLATGAFTYTGSLQTCTIPAGKPAVSIQAIGAAGDSLSFDGTVAPGGKGASMEAGFRVTAGETLTILVGGAGGSGAGGGGTFVWTGTSPSATAATLLLAAGGGGGAGLPLPPGVVVLGYNSTGLDASTGTGGGSGGDNGYLNGGSGGTNGNGGGTPYNTTSGNSPASGGGGGAGLLTDGGTSADGSAGGTAVSNSNHAGAGGGGGGYGGGGGGGGYSGGGGGYSDGGGGGSYASSNAIGLIAQAGAGTGNGSVTFSVVQASVSCLAPSGSTILSIDHVACTFLPGSGASFTGWTASGFSPSTSTSSAETFIAGPPTTATDATITAAYTDMANNTESLTFSYVILHDPSCTPGVLSHDSIPPPSAFTTLKPGDTVTCNFPLNFGAADDQIGFFNGFTNEATWSATDWFTPELSQDLYGLTFTLQQQGTDRDIAIAGLWMDGSGKPEFSSFSYNIAPTTTITAHPSNPTTQTSASFSFSGSRPDDAASNLTFACNLDSGSFSTCTSPPSCANFSPCTASQSYSGLAGGSHTFAVHATDSDGNTGADATYTWVVAAAAPTVSVSFSAANASGWYTAAPVIGTVTATDPATVTAIACTDNGTPVTLSSPSGSGTTTATGDLPISGEGTHDISCTATDGVGNSGAAPGSANTATLKLDSVAPQVTLSPGTPNGSNGWFKTAPVSVTVSASDTTSGVASFACTDGGAPVTVGSVSGAGASSASGTVAISGEGTHNLSCTATDAAGNTSSPGTATLKLDTTAPQITLATASSQTVAPSGWYNVASSGTSGVQVNVSASDSGSGVSSLTCSDTVGSTLSQVLNVSTASGLVTLHDGVHHLSCTATDGAGNSGAAQGSTAMPATYQIDQTPPAITASATTADSTAYSAGTWTNQAVTVTFTCADPGPGESGIDTNTVTGATVSSETSGQTVTNTGNCSDNAGNSADSATFGPIKIDKTAPLITASATTADGKPYTAGAWTNQAVTVTFTCAETGGVQSGLATNTVAGQTLKSQTSSSGQNVTNTGSCVDNAGNSALAVSFGPVLIDTTSPTLSCSADPSSIWPPNHKLVSVTLSVTLSDSLSGPNGFSLHSATASGKASDIHGFTVGQASTKGQVTANKDESYTLTYQGQDKAGNTASCTVTITVPHDQS
jgi:hypothetical protein